MGQAVKLILSLISPVLKQIFICLFEGIFKNIFGPLLEWLSWQLSPINAVSQRIQINGWKKFQPWNTLFLYLLNQNTDPGILHQCLTFCINKGCGYLELIDKCVNRFHRLMKSDHLFCSYPHWIDQATTASLYLLFVCLTNWAET